MSKRIVSRLGGAVALALLAWGAAATVGFTINASQSAGTTGDNAHQVTTVDSLQNSSLSTDVHALLDSPDCNSPAPTATPRPSDEVTPGMQATFHLCGQADPQTERAIEQLIGGRSFTARLVSQGDGCADLTITVPPNATAGTGQQSTNLTVSSNAGNGTRTISVRIVSENGQTQVSLAPAVSG